jgi:molecular chaperone Hsp33
MNTRTRFLFKELDIRGQHLSMSEAWQAMIENRSYSRQVRQLLGELSALAIMLTSGMKHKGKLTLQLQGDGVVSLMSEKELTKILLMINAKVKKGIVITKQDIEEQVLRT